ncbi:MAG: hypothetical protein MJY89_05680 [Bacteroidales bacterium]|nr:hypothetical protein [Bacteroidales bacterium]
MKGLNILLISLLSCFLISCREENINEEFILDSEVRMEVNGTEIFRFNPITCQESFNLDNCSFCVGTDTMSDFFSVKLNTLPTQEGQIVFGFIRWTTPTSISTKDNVTLEVIKLEGDKVWLWSTSTRMGMVVRFLY